VQFGEQEDDMVLTTTHERADGFGSGTMRQMWFGEADPSDEEDLFGRLPVQPERRLFFAILADAVVRVRRLATTPHTALRTDLKEAERWVRSNDRTWPCSFINVCEALDIAYEPLRRALLRRRPLATRRRVTRRGLLISAKHSRAAVDVEPSVD
jgi:hypothetical protein